MVEDERQAYGDGCRVDVQTVPGRGGGFSLEAPEGVRFLIRSRLLTEEERAALPAAPTGATTDR